MVVQDCANTVLKREVLYLTLEMSEFRRNISRRIRQDEALLDTPFNMLALPEGFKKAWSV